MGERALDGLSRVIQAISSLRRSGRGGLQLLILLGLFLSPLPALAVNPDEVLPDPTLEARARTLSAKLRCMVCQNQSIDDSNADLAKDLRLLVRERIANGGSDEQVMNYIVSRYGEFVLLNPPFSEKTWLLWGTPGMLFVLGGLVIVFYARRHSRKPTDRALTAEEEALLADYE
ncbi:cytochrome c-type biogenesis protein CcmH [Bradyrhizobium japonicum]|uniref:Cytochrome c-type biogenesis protein n=1 Tax=Bradyrhizobium japonicum TaxID=375 RepID=A0A1Y2JRB2_BRAJP|nr:cytochrome c-type biogenesis protein CcmH [Bradyrhizobium japonicum]